MAMVMSAPEGERPRSGSFDIDSSTKRRLVLGGVGFGNMLDSEIKLRFASNNKKPDNPQPPVPNSDTASNLGNTSQPATTMISRPRPPPVAPKPSKSLYNTTLQSLPIKMEKKELLTMPSILLPKTQQPQPIPAVTIANRMKSQAKPEVYSPSVEVPILSHPTKGRPRLQRKSEKTSSNVSAVASPSTSVKSNDENVELPVQRTAGLVEIPVHIKRTGVFEQKVMVATVVKTKQVEQQSPISTKEKREACNNVGSAAYSSTASVVPIVSQVVPKIGAIPVIPLFKGIDARTPILPMESQLSANCNITGNGAQDQEAVIFAKISSLSEKYKNLEREMNELRYQNQQQIFRLERHITGLRQQLTIAQDQINKLTTDLNEERNMQALHGSIHSIVSDQLETDV